MEKLDITNLVRNFLDTCTVQKKNKPHEPIMGAYGYVFSVLGSAFRVYMLRTTGQMPIQGDTIKKYFVEVFKENYDKGLYGRFQESGHIFYIERACEHLYLNHIGETYYCLYKTLLFKTTLNKKTLLETENETFARLVKQKLFKSKAFTTINGASEYLEEPYLSYYNDMLIAEGVVEDKTDTIPTEETDKVQEDLLRENIIENKKIEEDIAVKLSRWLSDIKDAERDLITKDTLIDSFIHKAMVASGSEYLKKGVIISTDPMAIKMLEDKEDALKDYIRALYALCILIESNSLFKTRGVLPLQQFVGKAMDLKIS